MASNTSTETPVLRWAGQRVDHATFAATLAERRKAAGDPEMPRNAGNRRTDSKRALLAAITKAGGDW